MDGVLIVVRPFGRYAVGDIIDDWRLAAGILTGEHAHNVVRVAETAPPAPQRREK